MWLTLLIIHLVVLIFILIMIYLICKKKTRIVEKEEIKGSFMIKLDKIKKRLKKLEKMST